ARRLAVGRRAAAEIEVATGRRVVAYAADVGRWEELRPLVERVYGSFGRIDVLVNNAGKSPLYPSVEEIDEAYWDAVVGLNLKGPFRLAALVGGRRAGGSSTSPASRRAIPVPTRSPTPPPKRDSRRSPWGSPIPGGRRSGSTRS